MRQPRRPEPPQKTKARWTRDELESMSVKELARLAGVDLADVDLG